MSKAAAVTDLRDQLATRAPSKTVHRVMETPEGYVFSCPSKVHYGDRGTLDKERVTCWACLNWWECW
jgi:hypothetical protein